ncbi:MAG TPA: 50S ribosomal protein L35 [Thermodesulfobacteriota bacterium]|nr:50S ribosomal protein L35 [Thermodesulfobacteriota bacterium]
MAKIKVKTNRGAAKRFKVTATGKIKRWSGGKSHLNVKKSRKRKRRLLSGDYMEGEQARRIKRYIPYL